MRWADDIVGEEEPISISGQENLDAGDTNHIEEDRTNPTMVNNRGMRMSFRQLFVDNRNPKHGMRLEYIEPQRN